jgi:hypothetical protein
VSAAKLAYCPSIDQLLFKRIPINAFQVFFLYASKEPGAGESNSASGNHEFYGVGLDGKINETIKYRVEPERMNIGSIDMDNIGASLLFGF